MLSSSQFCCFLFHEVSYFTFCAQYVRLCFEKWKCSACELKWIYVCIFIVLKYVTVNIFYSSNIWPHRWHWIVSQNAHILMVSGSGACHFFLFVFIRTLSFEYGRHIVSYINNLLTKKNFFEFRPSSIRPPQCRSAFTHLCFFSSNLTMEQLLLEHFSFCVKKHVYS